MLCDGCWEIDAFLVDAEQAAWCAANKAKASTVKQEATEVATLIRHLTDALTHARAAQALLSPAPDLDAVEGRR